MSERHFAVNTMNDIKRSDSYLVRACLSGSEQAWNEFYRRFIGLVKHEVKRKLWNYHQDSEDIVQEVFAAVIASLKTYDPSYPLSKFVAMVAARTCIEEYRGRTAAKRQGATDPIDSHDSGEEGLKTVKSNWRSQEEQLTQQQLIDLVRRGLRNLASKCREVLALRYYEEAPYKEIAKIFHSTEAAVAISARRCLNELKGHYKRLSVKGLGK
jgi:RNA polymerase sigma factor (sigma-70 family)